MKSIIILSLLAIASAKVLRLRDDAEIIPGAYLIKLKDNVEPEVFIANHQRMARMDGNIVPLSTMVTNVWNATIMGFAAKLDESQLKQLDMDAEIDWIEPDQIVRIDATVTQNNADWGIARKSNRATMSSPYTYRYDDTAGSNGRVYVIDTGIRITHNEFGGRAVFGQSYTGETTDNNGHGTHCAGSVGGTTYGVAKRATLVAVNVLSSSGSGTLANVISGVNWAKSNADSNSARVNVLSMSLGSSSSATVNSAVAAVRNAGYVVAVAAGNSNANACNYSPAGEPRAFTVGATTVGDVRSSFSNFGSCVDIFSPGTSITSAWYTSNTATSTISGTSMATPLVAGLFAYVGTREGTTNANTLESRVLALAQSGRLTSIGTGSPNLLAQNELSQ